MIVITLTDCPPKVRGDLSKWLFEINTGVFVGNISARVREELWSRVCENVRSGRATMVFSAAGEQKLDFMVHNTTWEPVDFDGLKLMCRPAPRVTPQPERDAAWQGTSKAARYEKLRRINAARLRKVQTEPYTVIDLETTGLSEKNDCILEFGALRVENDRVTEELSMLVLPDVPIPEQISRLTGITEDEVKKDGLPPKTALANFLDFIRDARLVGHNIAFDFGFLRAGCKKYGFELPTNRVTDTLFLAKKKLYDVNDYKLTTIAEAVGLDISGAHRALADCYLTHEIFIKLNKM